jgi:hypothetical protein
MAGNRNPLMIWQSRELVCMPAHITCLMASWPTREKPAVLTAYGFSAKKDLLTQLLVLNLAVAQRLEKAEPVTPPGIPSAFPNPENPDFRRLHPPAGHCVGCPLKTLRAKL